MKLEDDDSECNVNMAEEQRKETVDEHETYNGEEEEEAYVAVV